MINSVHELVRAPKALLLSTLASEGPAQKAPLDVGTSPPSLYNHETLELNRRQHHLPEWLIPPDTTCSLYPALETSLSNGSEIVTELRVESSETKCTPPLEMLEEHTILPHGTEN